MNEISGKEVKCLNLFTRKKEENLSAIPAVQTARENMGGFSALSEMTSLYTPQLRLYKAMRDQIPIIDAALYKIQRLIGGFKLTCESEEAERELNYFARNVKTSAGTIGLENFIVTYLGSLLLNGNAVGEMVLNQEMTEILALYNASMEDVVLREKGTPLDVEICVKTSKGIMPVKNQNLIFFSANDPEPGEYMGKSILRSLPFVSSVLLKIYNAMEQNFERLGNVRFAVTYKPGKDAPEQAFAKEHAKQLADEWSQGMAAAKRGEAHDFIAIGDIDIKVIGADNQVLDYQVPARQMLEQIVAKLSLPPFMLGLSWATTERMSKQQADALSNELCYFRRLLNPVIIKICRTYLRLHGYPDEPFIEWDTLNFEDMLDAAQTRLYNAQAAQIEIANGQEPLQVPVDISATR